MSSQEFGIPTDPIPLAACLPLTPEREADLRLKVIQEAQKWIGTPYRQQADILGAGIDCSMLLVRAWVDSGTVQPFDPRPYPPNWHMNNDEERYLHWMDKCALEVEQPKAGDVVLFKFGRCFSHSGVLVNETQMVHAWAADGKCSQADLNEAWVRYLGKTMTLRPRKFFDVWAKIRQIAGGSV